MCLADTRSGVFCEGVVDDGEEWFDVERLRQIEFSASLNPKNRHHLIGLFDASVSRLRALELVNERRLQAPFIIVPGSIGEETAVAAMRSGAADYLLKDRLARFAQAVEGALEQRRLRDERKQAEERLCEQTDIINRAQDAVIIRNFETDRITFWNSGAERLYGWSSSQAIGRPMGELIFAEAGHRDVLIKRLISRRTMGRKRLPFSRNNRMRLS